MKQSTAAGKVPARRARWRGTATTRLTQDDLGPVLVAEHEVGHEHAPAHVERLWREVRLYKIAPVSQQVALNYLAEHVLGLPKSY